MKIPHLRCFENLYGLLPLLEISRVSLRPKRESWRKLHTHTHVGLRGSVETSRLSKSPLAPGPSSDTHLRRSLATENTPFKENATFPSFLRYR